MGLFVEGEALCDAGQLYSGMACFKRANQMCWELDSTDWPGWANSLYQHLQSGVLPPPPVLALQATAATERFISPALRELCAGAMLPHWWDSHEGVVAVSATLAMQHFCIIDGLAGAEVASAFRAACETRWHAGTLFQPATVTGPGGGTSGTRAATSRSDWLAWVDHTAAAGTAAADAPAEAAAVNDLVSSLHLIVECIDRLVRPLAAELAGGGEDVTRQRPQVARYGDGDAFERHCDNYCPGGGGGTDCNGRWLTAVYYTNAAWADGDGGCLRIFQPQVEEDEHGDGNGASACPDDDTLVDVAPLADRLLLFHSDVRCPHAVLPVAPGSAARYAATVWFNRRSVQSPDRRAPPESSQRGGALVDSVEEETRG